MKAIFVVKGESELFVVREEEGDYKVGDRYDCEMTVIGKLDLPVDPRLDGLMTVEEIEGLLLQVIDTVYCQGRRHEQARLQGRLLEMHDNIESFLLEW